MFAEPQNKTTFLAQLMQAKARFTLSTSAKRMKPKKKPASVENARPSR
jgi:hypothetical protein